jgi:hypothetical protein
MLNPLLWRLNELLLKDRFSGLLIEQPSPVFGHIANATSQKLRPKSLA